MNVDSRVFEFETDFAGTLRCIPMCVRYKLDEVGVKLSLKQWNSFPAPERRRLVELPCRTAEQIGSFSDTLAGLVELHCGGDVEFVPADPPSWANGSDVPPRVAAYALALHLSPPSPERWASLSPLQRFALFKLTRANHDNDNFIPAMREFGLLD